VELYSSKSVEELIQSCAESRNERAWQEFLDRFHRPISQSIVRTALKWGAIPREVIDDLIQETYLRLCADRCKLLLECARRYPDGVVGYIRVIARNVAQDHFKSLYSQKRGAAVTAQQTEEFEVKAALSAYGGEEAIVLEVQLNEIQTCLEKCTEGPHRERDHTIFWLRHRQGMTTKEISSLPTVDLTAKGVESALARLFDLLCQCLRGLGSAPPEAPNSG
jgi:RNA polymerase sigma-70 factor (ECF subfamily)